MKSFIGGRAICIASLLILLTVNSQAADASRPFVHPVFGSHMVLQRGMKDPIWGWTKPGARVTLRMDGKRFTATADPTGKWMAAIGPFKAGGPYTLTISGPEEVTFTDVLVGDVWLCSGQSNMEMGIANVKDADNEIQSANYPRIRLFGVPKVIRHEAQPLFGPMKNGEPSWPKGRVEWLPCSPENIRVGDWGGFTAAGYFFGRKLAQDLDVPIGLIQSAWGGTICEAWVSADALEKMADFKEAVEKVRQEAASERSGEMTEERDEKAVSQWYAKNDPGSAGGVGWGASEVDDQAWKTMMLPTKWEAAGLPDYDGVVWFRREVTVPESWAGKDLLLHLGPIDDRDTTFFNGARVGGRDIYLQPRDYTIPARLVQPGKNVIAVRVLDTGGDGGLYGRPEDLRLELRAHREDRISLAGEWRYKDSMPLNKASSPPPPPAGDSSNPNVTTVLYNGMIAPLTPMAIKGAIWYQGESNAGRGRQYRTLLATMIRDWRARFSGGDFPFFIVQLAGFTPVKDEPGDSNWAEIREAQQLAAERVGHAATASAMDIGEAKDIHPKNKQEVGRRLALCAEAVAYGKPIEFEGPTFKSVELKDGHAILHFDHLGGGLEAKGDSLKGFSIAGADGHFVWADAKIAGDTVVVSSDKVSQPNAVRYAWADNPDANLYNKAGLPANSFRTDMPQ
jgi:sialate O-acetylesterase